MNKLLTKTLYKETMNCERRAWLMANDPKVIPAREPSAIEMEGIHINDIAAGLFDSVRYVDMSLTELEKAAQTAAWIKEGNITIAEATFIAERLSCRVDYLKVNEDGSLEINEVKGKGQAVRKERSKNKVKYWAELLPEMLRDIGFQQVVLSRCGCNVSKLNLIHVDSEYVMGDKLEIDKLLKVEDVTEEVMSFVRDLIDDEIDYALSVIDADIEPACNPERITKGTEGCKECDLFGHCHGHLPAPNIFNISGAFSKRYECYENGIITFEDLNRAGLLKGRQEEQLRVELSGTPIINEPEIKALMDKHVKYPIYFLDFESYSKAVPEYEGQWPFEQVPTQFSLDIIAHPAADIQHYEHLADENIDPRREIAELLVSLIKPGDGCIVVYSKKFEHGRIKELAGMFPDLARELEAMLEMIVDFEVPFQKRYYYLKEMEGLSTIKLVLPALFPDDPDIDYKSLPGVKKGDQASDMFIKLREMDPVERAKQRAYMLRYCNLDTLAMIKLYEALLKAINDPQHIAISEAIERHVSKLKDRYAEEDKALDALEKDLSVA